MQNTTTKYGLPFDSKINSEFVTYMGIALGMSPRFALVKYGGGITQMSGSIAGNTFARNRFGNYVRARTKPVNPRSTAQEKIRSVMAYLAERWHADLVASNRTAWANYAAAVAMKNKLGETIHLSGFNHFIRSNSDRLYSGESVLDGGPTVLSLPETDPTTSATYSVATNLISFSYDITMDHALEPGAYMKVYQGKPLAGECRPSITTRLSASANHTFRPESLVILEDFESRRQIINTNGHQLCRNCVAKIAA